MHKGFYNHTVAFPHSFLHSGSLKQIKSTTSLINSLSLIPN